jgi:transcriptional regulator with XRE-family HTH domain
MRLDRNLCMRFVAGAIGTSIQEMKLFEAGFTRPGAARLFQLAKLYDVPIGAFFASDDGHDEAAQQTARTHSRSIH